MRLFSVAMLVFLLSSSATARTCYSVQIWSRKTEDSSGKQKEDKSCTLYRRGRYTVDRCGCFSRRDDAESALAHYRRRYPDAFITKIAATHSLRRHLGFERADGQGYREALGDNYLQAGNEYKTSDGLYGLTLEEKYEEYAHQRYEKEDNQAYAIRNYVDYQHYVKLNFSLFKDGFFEHKKIREREEKSYKVFYLQNLSTVLKNDFSDIGIFIEKLNSRINYLYYLSLTRLYKERMAGCKKRYDNDMMENYKYDRLRQTYHRYRRYAALYKKHEKLNITKEIRYLLKMVDHVTLRSRREIVDYALQHSSESRLTEAKNALLDESESYLDTVEVDIYARRNRIDELGSFDTMGIEIKLPLDRHESETERVNRLKQHSNLIVSASFKKNIENRISYLYLTFGDMQQLADIDREDILFYERRVKSFEKLKKNMIEPLRIDPDQEIVRAKQNMIDLKFNILRTRVKLIAILYEMAYISGRENLSKMIKRP